MTGWPPYRVHGSRNGDRMPRMVPSLPTSMRLHVLCVVWLPPIVFRKKKPKTRKETVRSIAKGKNEHRVFLVGNGKHHHHTTNKTLHTHIHTSHAHTHWDNTQHSLGRTCQLAIGPPVPPQWHAV
ncbi:hypothetical protein LZ32DRAFT_69817 [Colletotrichum eremochloae]|nr:hypothetical protein LZ32DRAFT_69817 [Colletotrichum eremochloae]